MGSGTYCSATRTVRAEASGFYTKALEEVFPSTQLNNAMNPHGVKIRESRDSEQHPNSLAIMLALDVTGSMGTIPHFLVKDGLPNVMDKIIQGGIADPQVLFLGVGDHECDKSPLQVGQFESSDELLDKWLTALHIERGGGGNDGESYMLPWYFAAQHTSIDCLEKRGQKGILITIGDEPVLPKVPSRFLQQLMGDGQYEDYKSEKLLEKAMEKYHVYHIHMRQGYNGTREEVINGWKQILRDNLMIAEKREDVEQIIADIVLKHGSDVDTPVTLPEDETVEEEVIL